MMNFGFGGSNGLMTWSQSQLTPYGQQSQFNFFFNNGLIRQPFQVASFIPMQPSAPNYQATMFPSYGFNPAIPQPGIGFPPDYYPFPPAPPRPPVNPFQNMLQTLLQILLIAVMGQMLNDIIQKKELNGKINSGQVLLEQANRFLSEGDLQGLADQSRYQQLLATDRARSAMEYEGLPTNLDYDADALQQAFGAELGEISGTGTNARFHYGQAQQFLNKATELERYREAKGIVNENLDRLIDRLKARAKNHYRVGQTTLSGEHLQAELETGNGVLERSTVHLSNDALDELKSANNTTIKDETNRTIMAMMAAGTLPEIALDNEALEKHFGTQHGKMVANGNEAKFHYDQAQVLLNEVDRLEAYKNTNGITDERFDQLVSQLRNRAQSHYQVGQRIGIHDKLDDTRKSLDSAGFNHWSDDELQDAVTNNNVAGQSAIWNKTHYDILKNKKSPILPSNRAELAQAYGGETRTSYGNGGNYHLGQAQLMLDTVKDLKAFKEANGLGDCPEIDTLIQQLEIRGKNHYFISQRIGSPIVLDMDGNGTIDLTSVEDGVQFDLDGNGVKEQVAWTQAKGNGTDGWLVFDRSGNSAVDNGKELFGDQHGAVNGFEELRKFDTNGDGIIDQADAIYHQLKIWQDFNKDGICDAGELKSLLDAGIVRIFLDYTESTERDVHGNQLRQQGRFERSDELATKIAAAQGITLEEAKQGLAIDAWLQWND